MGKSGLPDGWFALHAMPAGAYRFELANEGRTGKSSLLIEGAGQYGVAWGEKLPIDRSQRYRAKGYVRIEGEAQAAADVKLHYYGENQEYLGQSRVGFINPRTNGWQLITVTDQIELFPKARHISIAVALAGKGKAWFDDIEMFATTADVERGPVNYVANGDMEDVAADRPAGWFVLANEGSTPTARFDEKIMKEGKRSLFLEAKGDWVAAGSAQIVPEKGKTYVLAGWARAARGRALLEFGYFQGEKFLGKTSSEEITTDQWQTRSVTTELDEFPNATHFIAIATGEGDVAAWFDGISVSAK